MVHNVIMPKLAETMEEGTIARWHKAEGEWIEKGELLLEVEMEKTTMEVPSPVSGYLRKVLFQEGETVPVTRVIAYVTTTKDEGLPTAPPDGSGAEERKAALHAGPSPDERRGESHVEGRIEGREIATLEGEDRAKASPAARRLAREHGIDLSSLQGTGPGGRITEADVKKAIEVKVGKAGVNEAGASEATVRAQAGTQLPGRVVKMNQTRQVTARRLSESKRTIPHFYVSIDVDMSEAVRMREELNAQSQVRISYNDLIIKAVSFALRDYPMMNSRFSEEGIIVQDAVNVGVAVSLEDGLIVPVIRNADKKSIREIADESRKLVEKARGGTLFLDEYTGGTFTVSNMGMLGVDSFAAIINPPEVGILAVGKISLKPIVKDGQLSTGHIMNVTLSVDHRVIDGALAARFLNSVKLYLEEPKRLLSELF